MIKLRLAALRHSGEDNDSQSQSQPLAMNSPMQGSQPLGSSNLNPNPISPSPIQPRMVLSNDPNANARRDLPPPPLHLPNPTYNGFSPQQSPMPSPRDELPLPPIPPLASPSGSGFLLSPNPTQEGFNLPPPSPSSPSFKSGNASGTKKTKTNPLTDLMDSEKGYVDVLGAIIRKVASAWSRSNFPPKELDQMFRGIEAVYKANKALLAKLKDIGPNPSSPKALGDLLMRWVEDLDKPYTKYCNSYLTGFDTWTPILANTRLPPILAALSAEQPLPTNPDGTWTLDALFLLPWTRLKYYKKLYSRLLKSAQPGRRDHKLLTDAVEKLEGLLGVLAGRQNIVVGEGAAEEEQTTPVAEVQAGGGAGPSVPRKQEPSVNVTPNGSETTEERARGSVGSSVPASSVSSSGIRESRDTISDASSRVTSSATMSMPISHLEKRLATEKVLDIFTMKPKSVRLQMNPPSLPFTRTIRTSCDVEISFAPRNAPDMRYVHSRGHVYVLTDLFLVCERMTEDERREANATPEGQDYDMWLLYPPLAGKHLKVLESPDNEKALHILVLKKETLVLKVSSKEERDALIKMFRECQDAGQMLTTRPGQPPPPPVPPLNLTKVSGGSNGSPAQDQNQPPSQGPPSAMSPPPPSGMVSAPPRRSSASAPVAGLPGGMPPRPDDGRELPPPPPDPKSPPPQQRPLPPLQQPGGPPVSSPPPPQPGPFGPGPGPQGNAPYTSPPRGDASQSRFNQFPPSRMGPGGRPSTAPGPGNSPALSTYPGQHPPGAPFGAPRFGGPQGFPGGPPGSHRFPGGPPGPPFAGGPPRPPSAPLSPPQPPALHKSASTLSLNSAFPPQQNYPPRGGPGQPGPYGNPGYTSPPPPPPGAINSLPQLYQPQARAPATLTQRAPSFAPSFATTSSWSTPPMNEPSPPPSPDEEEGFKGPVTSILTGNFKCKIFLQLQHGQWKSLGGGKLSLYDQQPTNVKQIVVESESKDKGVLISTIVLSDGVERVGKTGVAIELSDKGSRTGIVYMIQLRNEKSASGLFESLIAGSDRAAGRRA